MIIGGIDMIELHVKRKLSFVNDRSRMYLFCDGQKLGKIYPVADNVFKIDEGRHDFYVKDLLGFKSESLSVDTFEDKVIYLEALTASHQILLIFLLFIIIILSIALKIEYFYRFIIIGAAFLIFLISSFLKRPYILRLIS